MSIAPFDDFREAVSQAVAFAKSLPRQNARPLPSSRASGSLATCVANLRKSFLKLKRRFPLERYPRVAFQLAAIEPLVDQIVATFPAAPSQMLLLLREIKIKSDLDLSAEIESEGASIQAPPQPLFLPDDLIEDRHHVLKKILWEVNSTYETACYNSCAAMIRRLAESMIIAAYERHNLQMVVTDADGNYLAFKDLIGKATSQREFKLTRETKRVLPDLKFFGDLAAHNPLALVRKPDLDRLHAATRCAIEELSRNI